ncbi:MAG: NADPH-dependent FMN reductase [Gemmatimonadaceae bacterium]
MTTPDTIKLALIIGSTRPNRFADVPARWVQEGAAARSDFMLEVLDLRDWPLPFYEEPASPLATGGTYSNPVAERWRHRIGEFDGFIATAAEYNHGPTAVLKNAFDSAFNEWSGKPIGFVGYGGVGGARAVEQLRMTAIELQMAPVKQAVHIGMEPFLGLLMHGKTLADYPYLAASRSALFDQLVWWARALKVARDASARAADLAA